MKPIAFGLEKIVYLLLICYTVALSAPSYAVLCLSGEGHIAIEEAHNSCEMEQMDDDCCQEKIACNDCSQEIQLIEGHHHHSCNDIVLNYSNPAFLNKYKVSSRVVLIHGITLPAKYFNSKKVDPLQRTPSSEYLYCKHLRSTILLI